MLAKIFIGCISWIATYGTAVGIKEFLLKEDPEYSEVYRHLFAVLTSILLQIYYGSL